MATVAERLLDLIKRSPGRTEAQLAETIFGDTGYQQRVNSTCRRLIQLGEVRREGEGGTGDPFKYYTTR